MPIFCLLLGVLFLSAPVSHAQNGVSEITFPGPGYTLRNIFPLGDVTGDGVPDLGIHAILSTPPNYIEVAMVYSFPAQAVVAQIAVPVYDQVGGFISDAPDLDGDGVLELAVQRRRQTTSIVFDGIEVYKISGVSAPTLLRSHASIVAPGQMSAVNTYNLGDLNQDGVGELGMVECQSSTSFAYLRIFSGISGSVYFTYNGLGSFPCSALSNGWSPSTATLSGPVLARLGDINNDGFNDFAVGVPRAVQVGAATYPGKVDVYSGSGSLIRSHYGVIGTPSPVWGAFGRRVYGNQDLDGDGRPDYIISAPETALAGSGNYVGRIQAHSGATGALLYTVFSDEVSQAQRFSAFTSNLIHVGGRATADIVTSVPISSSPAGGFIQINAGDTGELIYKFRYYTLPNAVNPNPPLSGVVLTDLVQTIEDVTGDGIGDFILRDTFYNKLWLLSGSRLYMQAHSINVSFGGTAHFTARTGVPGTVTVLSLEEYQGIPLAPNPLVTNFFDFAGQAVFSLPAPNGIPSGKYGFRAYSLDSSAQLISSGIEAIYVY